MTMFCSNSQPFWTGFQSLVLICFHLSTQMFIESMSFSTHMTGENYAALLDIVKVLLVLSHGQASVQQGFSVNKETEVENLHEHSLVAQRIICDHLRAVGGVLNVPVKKKLLAAAASF